MSYHHTLRLPGGRVDQTSVARAPSVSKVEDTGATLLIAFQDGETLLLFRDGDAGWGERLTDGQIRNLILLAHEIGGNVVGDEGEEYHVRNGVVCEKPSVARATPMGTLRRMIQTTHPVSLFLFIGGAIVIVLIFILRMLG